MNRSLTVLLPVRDAESTLADTVARVLDMAAVESDCFELLIIDDASIDGTSEVVAELCRRYPQIRAIHNKKPLGEEAVVRLALAQSRDDAVVVRGTARPVFQRIYSKIPPVRPNYLGRARTCIREGI